MLTVYMESLQRRAIWELKIYLDATFMCSQSEAIRTKSVHNHHWSQDDCTGYETTAK